MYGLIFSSTHVMSAAMDMYEPVIRSTTSKARVPANTTLMISRLVELRAEARKLSSRFLVFCSRPSCVYISMASEITFAISLSASSSLRQPSMVFSTSTARLRMRLSRSSTLIFSERRLLASSPGSAGGTTNPSHDSRRNTWISPRVMQSSVHSERVSRMMFIESGLHSYVSMMRRALRSTSARMKQRMNTDRMKMFRACSPAKAVRMSSCLLAPGPAHITPIFPMIITSSSLRS
mmetsp:Transcript_24164/g.75887  ORF Transcript_24164/g.75887 Transcript_24164/m.75887 type:complete len:235 (-) Transcript_24164:1508-2212(-)